MPGVGLMPRRSPSLLRGNDRASRQNRSGSRGHHAMNYFVIRYSVLSRSGFAMDDMMPVDAEQEQVRSLLPGRKYVRLQLPAMPVQGLPTPINIHLDFDAGTVDEMLNRLTILRAQILPKLPAAKKRN